MDLRRVGTFELLFCLFLIPVGRLINKLCSLARKSHLFFSLTDRKVLGQVTMSATEVTPLDVELEQKKEKIKAQIRRELKIKEGADNLYKAAKDAKQRKNVSTILKASESKINDLRDELQRLNAQVADVGEDAFHLSFPSRKTYIHTRCLLYSLLLLTVSTPSPCYLLRRGKPFLAFLFSYFLKTMLCSPRLVACSGHWANT